MSVHDDVVALAGTCSNPACETCSAGEDAKPLDLEAMGRDRMTDLRAAEVAVTLQTTHRGGAHLFAFAHDIRDAGVELTRARSAESALVAEVKRLRDALVIAAHGATDADRTDIAAVVRIRRIARHALGLPLEGS